MIRMRAFRCTAGVKQGCSARPLLFGLYIDELEALLRAENNHVDASKLLDTLVAILLFAGENALMSYFPAGLHHQLSILARYCANCGLNVNVTKTKIVVCEPKRSKWPALHLKGESLKVLRFFSI